MRLDHDLHMHTNLSACCRDTFVVTGNQRQMNPSNIPVYLVLLLYRLSENVAPFPYNGKCLPLTFFDD
jgi:hypothetical protein